jgi:Arc/MetJ-type ribon-helix-helix transcriptional regulator
LTPKVVLCDNRDGELMDREDNLLLPTAMLPRNPGALRQQYQGNLSEKEARRLLTTTVRLDADILTIIDEIVGNPSTEYQSRGDFIRHALMMLLNDWMEAGFPREYISDVLNRVREEKVNAHRLKMRQEFVDILAVYEQSLSGGSEVGDWSLVLETLARLQGYVDRTDETYWREHIRKVIAQSAVVQHTISSLYEASRERKDLKEPGEYWQRWLESLS